MSINCDVIVIFLIYCQFGALIVRFFAKKNADISKIKRVLVLKVYFLKLQMCVYLHTKFQVSSIIPTSFRPGEGLTHVNNTLFLLESTMLTKTSNTMI